MTELLVVGLAGWRLAYLLTVEAGPFDVMSRIRSLAGVPPQGEVRGFLPVLFSCVFCMSFWTALAVWGLWRLEPEAVVPLAAWGLASAVERHFRR